MGINYYFHMEMPPPCECCGRPYEKLYYHIGKSSAGWYFALHIDPSKNLNSFTDWVAFLSSAEGVIKNEYRDEISLKQMLSIITNRRGYKKPFSKNAEWYNINNAEPAEYNLVRARIDGQFCVGHGDGTFDYMQGDFS